MAANTLGVNAPDSTSRGVYPARKFSAYDARPMMVHTSGSSVAVYAAIHCADEVFSPDEHVGSHAMLNLMTPLVRPRHFWKTQDWREEQALGELSFLPPGTTYSSRSTPCENHVTTLSLSNDLLERTREEIGVARDLRTCADLYSPQIRMLMGLLSSEIRNPGLASDLYVSSLLTAVAIELIRHFAGGTVERQDHWGDTVRVKRVIDFIAAHLDQSLSIELIAKECGVSPRHLSRIFTASTGVSLWHYVSTRRIELARSLLASGHARVKDVSRRCGFDNSTTFTAAFRNGTGMTPSQFLRREAGTPGCIPANTDRGNG